VLATSRDLSGKTEAAGFKLALIMRCCYWRMELWHATIHRHTHLFCLKMSHIFLHGQWVSSKFKSTYHIMFTVLSFIFRVRQTQMRPSAMFYLWVLHLSCCHGYPLESTPGECVCVCVCVPRTQQRSEEHHSQVKIDILPPTLLNFYTSSHTHTHTHTHTDGYCACRSWAQCLRIRQNTWTKIVVM